MLYEDEAYSEAELTDSQVNHFIGKMEMYKEGGIDKSELSDEDDLQTVVYNTLMLDYDIFLNREELKYYKVILTEK